MNFVYETSQNRFLNSLLLYNKIKKKSETIEEEFKNLVTFLKDELCSQKEWLRVLYLSVFRIVEHKDLKFKLKPIYHIKV